MPSISELLTKYSQPTMPVSAAQSVDDLLEKYGTQAAVKTAPQPQESIDDLLNKYQPQPSAPVSIQPQGGVGDLLQKYGPKEKPAPPIPAILAPKEGIREIDRSGLTPAEGGPVERGVGGKFAESFRRGREGVAADIEVGRAVAAVPQTGPTLVSDIGAIGQAVGDLTPEEQAKIQPFLEKQIKQQRIEEMDPITGRNWFSKGVYEAARMTGGMFETMRKAWDEALAGAAIGAGIGSIVPGAGTLVGAKAGLSWGFTTGTAKEWYFQGLGDMYRNMTQKGIDPETAKDTAMIAAIPYAATEFVFQQLPGLRGLFEVTKVPARKAAQTFGQFMMKAVAHVMRQHGIQALGEITEEGIQQVITDVGENVATYLHNNRKDDSLEGKRAAEVVANAVNTMLQSAVPMTLSMAPYVGGRMIEAASDYHAQAGKDQAAGEAGAGAPAPTAEPEQAAPVDMDARQRVLQERAQSMAWQNQEPGPARDAALKDRADAAGELVAGLRKGDQVERDGEVWVVEDNGKSSITLLREGETDINQASVLKPGEFAAEFLPDVQGDAMTTLRPDGTLAGMEPQRTPIEQARAAVDAVPPKADGSVDMEARQLVLDEWKADPANAEAVREIEGEGRTIPSLYHGTQARDIDAFKVPYGEEGIERRTTNPLGVYFAESPQIASKFGETVLQRWLKPGVKILDITDAKTVGETLQRIGVSVSPSTDIFQRLHDTIAHHGSQYAIIEQLRRRVVDAVSSQGYGGIRLLDKTGTETHPSVVIFNPTDILTAAPSPLTLRPDGTLAGVEQAAPPVTTTPEMEAGSPEGAAQLEEELATEQAEAPDEVTPPKLATLGKFTRWLAQWPVFGEALAQKYMAKSQAYDYLYEQLQKFAAIGQKARAEASRVLDPVLAKKRTVASTILGKGAERAEIPIPTQAQRNEVTFMLEENDWSSRKQETAKLTPEQVRLYDAISEERDLITEAEKSAKILTDETIDKIKETFGGYMPHGLVAQAFKGMTEKQAKELGNTKLSTGETLRQYHQRRKGKLSLREYAALTDKDGKPLLDPDIFEPTRALTTMLASHYERMLVKDLIDYGKANGLIVRTKEKLGPDWIDVPAGLRGASALGEGGQKVHRMYAQALAEIAGVNAEKKGFFDKVLTITKIGQFFVPGIVWTYNELQGIQRGTRYFNPFSNIVQFGKAFKQFMTDPNIEVKMRELGAIQQPRRETLQTIERSNELYSRQMRQDLSLLHRAMESIAATPLKLPGMKDITLGNMLRALQIPYRAIGQLTWVGDSVQRLQSFNTYMDLYGKRAIKEYMAKGMSEADAVALVEKEAGQHVGAAHAAYSIVSQRYRDVLHKFFFVHTFRVLMPIENAKSIYGLPVQIGRALLGKEVKASEALRAARAFMGTVGTPIVIYGLMKANGWEPDEEGLPEWLKKLQATGMVEGKFPFPLPFATYKNYWKFKKTIDTERGPREIVVGVSDIVNMPMKWTMRLTKERPEKLGDGWYHIVDTMKWEANPLYRIALDLYTNESSMGGKRPSDPTDPVHKQIADRTWYAFRNIFRIYSLLTESNADTAYRREVKADLDRGLNGIEKALLGYYSGYTKTGAFMPTSYGYSYSRAERRVRLGIAMQQLSRAAAAEKGVIKRESKDNPEEIQRRLKELSIIEGERRRRLRYIFLGDK